jgi:hypothetical protein
MRAAPQAGSFKRAPQWSGRQIGDKIALYAPTHLGNLKPDA